jgi:hypothetical protein
MSSKSRTSKSLLIMVSAASVNPLDELKKGGGRIVTGCAKTSPPLVIPKPGLSARNLFAASGEAADSSRDKAALRNDNCFGDFRITALGKFGHLGLDVIRRWLAGKQDQRLERPRPLFTREN